MSGDLSGTNLGNYQLVSLVGKGGMGEVWLARHPMLGREVAVKVLAPALSGDQEALERFRREALTVNQIGHSTVVEVTDFGTLPDGRSYCVMELLRGQSLETYLGGQGPLNLHDAVAILVPVIEGLAAAHSAGVVHRDIKPDNVFLDTGKQGQRVIRILDFGIAKLLDPGDDAQRMTKTGQLLGTPLYMSPEQVSGDIKRIGPWSDVYSLGVLLYRMLAGRPPFLGESFGQILMAHMQTPPPSIVTTRPDVPAAVDAVIQRALAKDPAQRFTSMAMFSAELLRASAYQGTAPTMMAVGTDPGMVATPGGAPSAGSFAHDSALAPTVTPVHLTPVPLPETVVGAKGVAYAGASVPVPAPASAMSSLSLATGERAGPAPEQTLPVTRPRKSSRGALVAVIVVLSLCAGGVVAYLLTRPTDKKQPAKAAAAMAPASKPSRPRPPPKSLIPEGMVGVPAGCFTMGNRDGDPDEHPPHRVCLASFAMDRTEVSVNSYAQCVNAGVCQVPTGYLVSSDPKAEGAWKAKCNWNAPGRGNHPVNCVKWQPARTFCAWKGKRLPTEAEWEYAAQGSKGRLYPWGYAPPTCKLVVMDDSSGPGCGKGTTWPVGSKPAGKGPFGALDQAGNVWEWTEDCWALRFYDECAGSCSNPFNHCLGRDKRVIRGASFLDGPRKKDAYRTTLRGYYRPYTRGQGVGFRCVKSLPHGVVPGDLHADARPLTIARVKASSYLPPYRGRTYNPEHLFDGRLDTSWQPRGSKSDSKGQWVRIWFKTKGAHSGKSKVLITAVSLANGYQAMLDGVDQFYNNSRLKMITLHFSDGSHQRAFLPPDRREFVRLRISPKRTKWLLLQIESIYPGQKWRDVGISELKVWGKE